MILQRLVELYDRLASDDATADALPKPGYSLQKCSFAVMLHPDGRLENFRSLLVLSDKNQKPIPRQLLVPGQAKPPGSGINPCFLWDNAAYMLGYKADDPKPDRTRESFETFRDKHLALEQQINTPAFSAVCAFLRQWTPEQAMARAADLEPVAGSFGVFQLVGAPGFIHDDPAILSYWMTHGSGAADDNAPQGFCLVTGEYGPIATLHEPKIKGVIGSQSAGALLVSFNTSAYESYGKSQGANAPVSQTAAFKYTNALNYLLNNPHRRITLGDATVVFWAGAASPLEGMTGTLLGDWGEPAEDAPVEEKQRWQQARLFLSQLRDGHADGNAFAGSSDTPFYILGLSPNAARISVRFWHQTTVGELQHRLAAHMRAMMLVGLREGETPPIVRRIVQATGRADMQNGKFKSYDTDAVSPLLTGAVTYAVLTGTPYPQSLLAAMITRLRADGYISHVRIATIKACIVRNSDLTDQEKEKLVSLDTNRKDPGYVCGRLFAILEKAQQDSADGELNSTIKDRYFSAASATPGMVFPRLIRLNQHHLGRMEKPQKIYFDKQIGEVTDKLCGFPNQLNLEDQGLFAIGYFHQRQDLYTSKKNKQEGTDE